MSSINKFERHIPDRAIPIGAHMKSAHTHATDKFGVRFEHKMYEANTCMSYTCHPTRRWVKIIISTLILFIWGWNFHIPSPLIMRKGPISRLQTKLPPTHKQINCINHQKTKPQKLPLDPTMQTK